jgi:hypothetical protein
MKPLVFAGSLGLAAYAMACSGDDLTAESDAGRSGVVVAARR